MCQFSGKTDNFTFLGSNLPKKWILGLKFQKSKSGFEISTFKIPCEPIYTCCTNDRVASKVKVNIKETLMRNEGFLQVFMW